MEFNGIILTDVKKPITVNSLKGMMEKMTDRPTYGLSFCVSGQLTYIQNGKSYVSTPNTAVILPKRGNYRIRRDKHGLFLVINFECENFECGEIGVIPISDSDYFIKETENIKNMFLFSENRLEIFSRFYGILSRLRFEQLPKKDIVYKATEFIKENLSNPELSNSCIAENFNISEVYLRKLFSSRKMLSPKQYISDLRIQTAKQMLTDSPYNITVVSQQCGFSSVYSFSRAFREKTGMTPTEYARKNKICGI